MAQFHLFYFPLSISIVGMTVKTLPKIERQTITIPVQNCAYSASDVISMYLRRYPMTSSAATVYISSFQEYRALNTNPNFPTFE